MIGFALAAALSGAVVQGGELLDVAADIPSGSTSTGGGVELVVAPDGKVTSCREIASVGGPEVAAAMCRRLDHARLRPASTSDGAAFGLVRLFMQQTPAASGHELWRTGTRPEVELAVANIPVGMPTDQIVTTTLAVGADGNVVGCEAQPGIASPVGIAACDAARTLRFEAVSGPGGSPVAFVSTTAVRFVLGN